MDGITYQSVRSASWQSAPESQEPSPPGDSAAETGGHISDAGSPSGALLDFADIDPSQFENVTPMELGDIDTSLFEDGVDVQRPDDGFDPSWLTGIEEQDLDAISALFLASLRQPPPDAASTSGAAGVSVQRGAAVQSNSSPGEDNSNEALLYPSDFDLGAQPSRERNERLLKAVLKYLVADINEAVETNRIILRECRAIVRTGQETEVERAALSGFESYDIRLPENAGPNCLRFRFWYGNDGALRMQFVVAGKTSEEYIYPDALRAATTAGLCLFWAAAIAKRCITGYEEAARSVSISETRKLRQKIAERMLAADPMRAKLYKGGGLGGGSANSSLLNVLGSSLKTRAPSQMNAAQGTTRCCSRYGKKSA